MTTTTVAATEKQVAFMQTLINERQMATDMHKMYDAKLAAGVARSDASAMIKALMAMPKIVAANAVTQPGIYEMPDGTVYVAKFNKDKTNMYAKQVVETGERITEAGTIVTIDFEYAAGAIKKLTPAMKMDGEKAKALTIKYGRCLICGRKLKAAKSVEAGIGPVCAKYYGGGF